MAMTAPFIPAAQMLVAAGGIGGPGGAVIALSFRRPACSHCGWRHIVRAQQADH